jgi:2-dehydro-3-deoxy-D-arabinonate dehydratase
MKLVQFFVPGKGKRVGVLRGDRVLDITRAEEGIASTLDLLQQGKTTGGVRTRAEWLLRATRRGALEYRELQRSPTRRAPHLLVPLDPPEVWAARPREALAGPAVFFKATASRCAGTFGPLHIRSDSRRTLPCPGVGLVLSGTGEALGLAGYLGLSARDLLDHPLALSRAETYGTCCALGPCLALPDEFQETLRLQMRLSVEGGGAEMWSEAFDSPAVADLPEAARRLLRDNPCPFGTVLAVEVPPGTAPPALVGAEQVSLEIQGIGRLSHPVRRAEHSGSRAE